MGGRVLGCFVAGRTERDVGEQSLGVVCLLLNYKSAFSRVAGDHHRFWRCGQLVDRYGATGERLVHRRGTVAMERVPQNTWPRTGLRRCGPNAYPVFCVGYLCATALTALFCSTIPAVENRFDLLCQIGPALAGGILLSVVALQWGWRDHWSLSSFVCVLVCLPILTLMLVPWTSIKQDFAFLAVWLISGPLSVVAAQFIVVLIGCAVLRQPRSENTLCVK